jgi:hypothetical protein
LVGWWRGDSTSVNQIPGHFHQKVHDFKFMLEYPGDKINEHETQNKRKISNMMIWDDTM